MRAIGRGFNRFQTQNVQDLPISLSPHGISNMVEISLPKMPSPIRWPMPPHLVKLFTRPPISRSAHHRRYEEARGRTLKIRAHSMAKIQNRRYPQPLTEPIDGLMLLGEKCLQDAANTAAQQAIPMFSPKRSKSWNPIIKPIYECASTPRNPPRHRNLSTPSSFIPKSRHLPDSQFPQYPLFDRKAAHAEESAYLQPSIHFKKNNEGAIARFREFETRYNDGENGGN